MQWATTAGGKPGASRFGIKTTFFNDPLSEKKGGQVMISKEHLSKLVLALVAVWITFTLSACGTAVHQVKLQDNYAPTSDTKIEVGSVKNESGEVFEVNVEHLLRGALSGKLQAAGMRWNQGDGNKIVIDSKIVEYEPGDAFKRWLLPGWGATVLTVQCDLKEENELVGSVEARRTVSAGGGYTIGAWEDIFQDLAEDIVNDLQAKITPKPSND